MDSVLEYLTSAAGAHPDKVALADRDHSLTYGALLERVRTAGAFVAARCGQVRRVGVWARHDVHTPLLFLAVAWAGCCYVPLDPELPPAKLEKILRDCGLELILTAAADDGPPPEAGFSGAVATLAEALEAGAALPCPPMPRDRALPLSLLYTSGSTGAPKGVLKTHGAVLSFVEDFLREFPLPADTVFGNQTPFFFDASAKDLYWTLCLGARLEILEAGLFSFPLRLVERMNARRVTAICWVPSALAVVSQLNTFSEAVPQYLGDVFFVGEAMNLRQLNRWRAALPEARFVNLYGSTEMAGVCCAYRVAGEFADGDRLPMGRPFGRSTVLLEAEGRWVETPGVVGEVCVASPALAREYFGDPEKTAGTFRREALPSGETARVLHTGDLAQYTPEGLLTFAARRDHQFKHMGRRVEAGEIEAAADALEEVARSCCVYDRTRGRIVLYCQPAPGASPAPKALRQALRGSLSDYMVPARVVVLPQLPLNANGKLDRAALQARTEQ